MESLASDTAGSVYPKNGLLPVMNRRGDSTSVAKVLDRRPGMVGTGTRVWEMPAFHQMFDTAA
jgi:hypothetical protein